MFLRWDASSFEKMKKEGKRILRVVRELEQKIGYLLPESTLFSELRKKLHLKDCEKAIEKLIISGELYHPRKGWIERMGIKGEMGILSELKIPKAYSKMRRKTALDWAEILVHDSQMLRLEVKHNNMPVTGTIKMIKWDLKRIGEILGGKK